MDTMRWDEFEQLEVENLILATAFRNSYQIVTGKAKL